MKIAIDCGHGVGSDRGASGLTGQTVSTPSGYVRHYKTML